jgi:hypothetical protein
MFARVAPSAERTPISWVRLGDAARQHSVNPGSREHQGHDGECPEQGQREPALRGRPGDDMIH